MPLYGKEAWNPRLIIAQIVTVQCLHYIFSGLLYTIFHFLFASRLHLDLIFSWESLSHTTAPGWMIITNVLMVSILDAVSLLVVVERARKCLDFAVTIVFLHWVGTLLYSGNPMSWDWWIVNSIATTVTAVAGEQLCMKVELAEIKFKPLPGGYS